MKNNRYIPLFLIEGYLIFTLLLFQYGPLCFRIHEEKLFWILIFLYHFAFIIGYVLQIKVRNEIRAWRPLPIYSFRQRYTLGLLLSFFVWIVYTRSNTKATSYIPFDLIENAMIGIFNPGVRHYWKDSIAANMQFQSEPLVTACVVLFYFVYYCLPAFLVLYWKKITYLQKITSITLIVANVIVGISVGTNAIIFHELFSLMGGVMIKRYTEKKDNSGKLFLGIGIFLICCILYFSYNISNRLNGQEIMFYKSKSSDITVSSLYTNIHVPPMWLSSLASLEYYICQGYYGMSLALDKEFTPTFGFGHSFYLIKKFDKTFSSNLFSKTYQAKIDEIWPSARNWHSFYSQMANDVGFFGVIMVMFFLGKLVGMVWVDVLFHNNFFAKCLCVLFFPLFIFMPANNQLGNMTGTLVAFWEVLFLWLVSRRAGLRIGTFSIW